VAVTKKVLHCDCGFEARAEDEGELVDQIRRHALEAHGIAFTPAEALVLVSRAVPEETTTERDQ
jgi:predicted small metal-binding protein